MKRLCPLCGLRTEEVRCPQDGTGTLVLAQVPDSRLTAGTEINGRYLAGELIGKGGFGAVYRATSLATGQPVAIKVLGVSLEDDDAEQIQRFYAEAQVTASLKHPNTIRVFDFGQTEGGALFIAMELLSGKELHDLLKERRQEGQSLSQAETQRIAAQALRSLSEAHLNGLVHRDLKPQNIYLNEVAGDEPVVKVLDFGIAKRLGSNFTGTGQAFGTPTYMSPEQAQNHSVDGRSDLYSLAVMMYQCVTGACPFEGDNPLAVLLAHVTDEPPSVMERARTPISPEFARIIHKALSKRPAERFADAKEMRLALEDCPPPADTEPLSDVQLPPSGSGDVVDATVGRTAAYAPVVDEARLKRASSSAVSLTFDGGSDDISSPPQEQAAEAAAQGVEASYEYEELPKPSSGVGKLIAGLCVMLALGVGGWWALSSGAAEEPSTSGVEETAKPAPSPAQPHVVPVDVQPIEAKQRGDDVQTADVDAGARAASGGDTGTAPDASPADSVATPTVAKTHTVTLVSIPLHATVFVQGEKRGETPLPLVLQSDQQLKVRLEKRGYQSLELVLRPSDGPMYKIALTKNKTRKRSGRGGRGRKKADGAPSTPEFQRL